MSNKEYHDIIINLNANFIKNEVNKPFISGKRISTLEL